jgi:S-adenosylmethionine:tRNA ribosyltransferase-isomerase
MEGNSEPQYHLEKYDYALPASLIAQDPLAARATCRLLVVHRAGGTFEHKVFHKLHGYLQAGDVLVLNDTKVVPARLLGVKETGGRIELLVLEPFRSAEQNGGDVCTCLVKASKPPKPHSRVTLTGGLQAEILTPLEEGKARVRFLTSAPLPSILEQAGEVPLPPYIHRDGTGVQCNDAQSYQTVYAREPGSVAAPTAGLHFTAPLLHELAEYGVELVHVTLHVGYGTFAPMRGEDIREHRMHPEYAQITSAAAQSLARAKSEGRRIVAVGTTSARILEWVALKQGTVTSFCGYCDLFIYPGFQFQAVDALITNFHLPKSTLLLLVSAFAGRATILDAYREAINEKYRFFSYGDAMLIL